MTKLAAALPKGDGNGLDALNKDLCEVPGGTFMLVVVVDCKKVTTDMDTGEEEATARIRRIEALLPEDLDTVARAMLAAADKRLGKSVLPMPDEDLRDLLKSVNLSTGEVPEV